jgi:[ribosomal protein S18]-alanine N-acetyltransferase
MARLYGNARICRHNRKEGRSGADGMATIRNARADEADILAAVGFRAWDSTADGWGDAENIRDNAFRAFEMFTKDHWLAIDVAERAGQVLGWAAREKLDNAITDLWVEPIFQRQGIGTELLEHLEQEVLGAGHETIETQVHSENVAAIEFFRKSGFSVSWMTTAWSARLDRDVDTIGLVKRLVEEKNAEPYGEF